MISKRTVFILGAGASYDAYGLPTGEELKKRICDLEFSPQRSALESVFPNSKEQNLIEPFFKDFPNCHLSSIDEFLSHRQEYWEIGKTLIAYVIGQAEAHAITDSETKKRAHGQSCYTKIWQLMTTKCSAILNNEVAFITFNYDRSLEHFLTQALMSTYGLDQAIALQQLAAIPITHVYGISGKYFDEGGKLGIPFGWNQSNIPARDAFLTARACARSLTVMPENSTSAANFFTAQENIHCTKQICFLGFAYHDINMRRLFTAVTGKEIYCPFYEPTFPTDQLQSHIKKTWEPMPNPNTHSKYQHNWFFKELHGNQSLYEYLHYCLTFQ